MKKALLLLITLFNASMLFAQTRQPDAYGILVAKADSLYKVKDYKNSAFTYSTAFKAFNWHAAPIHHYAAALSWALADYPDSAFSHLYYIAQKTSYLNIDHNLDDPRFQNLHNDKRWLPLLAIIKANQANYNMPLVHELDTIFHDDQDNRVKLDSTYRKYGWHSTQFQILSKQIIYSDSINVVKVEHILDNYGWLGADQIGQRANTTLFLVIQHAKMKDRDKYLPMLREAVKNNIADPSSLALMEDRSALEHGKKQIYGSQMAQDKKTGKYYISPIEDEANVDKRRAEVGLEPLKNYVKQWDIDYKLPEH